MSVQSYDNEKISDLRRAAQLKMAKDRVQSNKMIFMFKRPKPRIIQYDMDDEHHPKINIKC
jgi:hypothetical protein